MEDFLYLQYERKKRKKAKDLNQSIAHSPSPFPLLSFLGQNSGHLLALMKEFMPDIFVLFLFFFVSPPRTLFYNFGKKKKNAEPVFVFEDTGRNEWVKKKGRKKERIAK